MTDATNVSIDNGIGVVATRSTKSVSPSATTTYTLTATGVGGTKTATAIVTVGIEPGYGGSLVDISQEGFSAPTFFAPNTYPPQWEWNPAAQYERTQASTTGTPLIKHIRNGVVIATYNKLAGYRCEPNNIDAHDTSVGPFRRFPYTQMQDGDIFEVYPAVYEGEDQQIFLGPNTRNNATYNAQQYYLPRNITIRGVTVGGVRPVIRAPSTGAAINTYGQGLIYVSRSENVTIENIDVECRAGAGSAGRAAIYVDGAQNLTLRHNTSAGFRLVKANGVFGTGNTRGTLLLENVELDDNGGDGGPEHNAYINASTVDPTYTFKVRGCRSHGAFYGHLLKSRAQITIVEGSYLSGTRAAAGAQTESYLLDVPEGGTLIARNNIFVKNFSGDFSNAMSITFAIEKNAATYAPTRPWRVLVEHNTFVAFSREYDNSGVAYRWLYPMFIPGDFPGERTVRHNLFVGYNITGNSMKDFRGENAVTLDFNQIDQAFRPPFLLRPETPASLAVWNTCIATQPHCEAPPRSAHAISRQSPP